ncbi:Site-specific recombinase XerD, partial [human gut metagenome]
MDECQNLYSPDGIRSYTTNIIIELLWSTGLRPSEPVNLLNEDVDFKNNTLHIRKQSFKRTVYTDTQKCNGTTLLL